jgi:hypothetical protein
MKRKSKKNVLTEEKVQDIQVRLQLGPRKSLRLLEQETCVSLGSAFTATKSIKLRTVVFQIPRSQFLRFLSLGKPKGKSLQE